MQRLHNRRVWLSYAKWKVPMSRPFIWSPCPGVRTLNLTNHNPSASREAICVTRKIRWSLQIRPMIFLSLPPRYRSTATLIKMKRWGWGWGSGGVMIYHLLKGRPTRCCAGNPLRSQGRVVYWVLTRGCHCICHGEMYRPGPYSLMIITDHLPKWLINKAEAKQIIYLYGSVDIKFTVNGPKRIACPCNAGDGWWHRGRDKTWPFLMHLKDRIRFFPFIQLWGPAFLYSFLPSLRSTALPLFQRLCLHNCANGGVALWPHPGAITRSPTSKVWISHRICKQILNPPPIGNGCR